MTWLFLFLAVGILSWFIALFYLKAYIKRRSGADYTLANLREEIRLLEAGIDEKTEQSLALLEEKIGELRKLCTEAEKRIAVYAQELARKIAEEAAFNALGRGEPPELSAAPVPPGFAGTPNPKKTPDFPGIPGGSSRKKTSPKGGGKRTSGRKKESSLLDSIEVREITAVRAAGAYHAQTRRPAGPAGRPAPAGDVPAGQAVPPVPAEASGVSAAPPSAPPRFIASANPVRPKAPPMKERVAELYRAGFSEDLVAARLGISITEARLYIAMASTTRRPPG
ncbi:MAG: hypothetical protein LBP69_08475 [Treponema sp.]|jgi:hypothetical protein|nr:hypothetical protein [Treponema sp.]